MFQPFISGDFASNLFGVTGKTGLPSQLGPWQMVYPTNKPAHSYSDYSGDGHGISVSF